MAHACLNPAPQETASQSHTCQMTEYTDIALSDLVRFNKIENVINLILSIPQTAGWRPECGEGGRGQAVMNYISIL